MFVIFCHGIPGIPGILAAHLQTAQLPSLILSTSSTSGSKILGLEALSGPQVMVTRCHNLRGFEAQDV